jgi:2-C-methyl-D-erythritol 4-phosphate cytidylyltransferase/2-C-methyl-D-erythritol 2,4-cyclodiphosphate synthase
LNVSVIVVAAGSGKRFGYERNKLFYPLCGKPVLAHTLRHVLDCPAVNELILVTSQDDEADIRTMLAALDPVIPVRWATGGATRQDSVYAGLCQCRTDTDIVLVHDGARPWAGPEWFDRGIQAMTTAVAAVYGIPLKDTVKECQSDAVFGSPLPVHTLERSRLIAVQTPQIFRYDVLLLAYEYARTHAVQVTDDASLVEAMGVPVCILDGDERNRKVTTKEDIPILELYMQGGSMVTQVGMGYDVHALVPDRKLVLGGITVPFERGLAGHSDADVLIHAVMDALLGAAGLRDIGTYFPDTDDQFKNISSVVLLENVRQILEDEHCRIIHIDVTLVAQRPKIRPYVPQMAACIAQALGVPLTAVSVKATTTEHLGFAGREEGMAAQAVATVAVPRKL